MNDEQSRRMAEAADAVLQANDAMDEARDAFADTRFESTQERDRLQASQLVAKRLDAAGKKIDEAIRKGAIAAAAVGTGGVFERYRASMSAAREGRSLARRSSEQDGTPAKRQMGADALARLEDALNGAAALVFGGVPG